MFRLVTSQPDSIRTHLVALLVPQSIKNRVCWGQSLVSFSQRGAALFHRWNALFRDHEIFVRTGGDVRFLTLSARVQRRVATLVAGVLLAWALFTIGMLGWQAAGAWERQDVAQRAVAVQRAEARVAAESTRVETIARDLDHRQDYLERLFTLHFGGDAAPAAKDAAATGNAADPQPATTSAPQDKVSMLRDVRARQDRLVVALTQAVEARAARAEAALRQLGIRPASDLAGRGGPFIPFPNRTGVAMPRDPAIARLTADLNRMQSLEEMVLALPSARPAEVIRLSSGFGYRHDPFTGAGAMHAGLDFTGAYGSPIRAAAAGRVVTAGPMSGYGNVVEVDHGHGILTRYAHLAGFATRVGALVAPGDVIARMGSTGRSTGTHLHFEVRVGGTPVNPLRFLEANSDVLEIKAVAGQRPRTRIAGR